jgi:hypothetical protein
MGVAVDESGRYDEPVRVYLLPSGLTDVAYLGYAIAGHGHVRPEALRAGTIYHPAVADHQIKGHSITSYRSLDAALLRLVDRADHRPGP